MFNGRNLAKMNYFFLVALAFLPSLVWLLFYLRKDSHPESNRMILKVFILGMLAAFPAIFIQLGFFDLSLPSLINIFIGVALVEESLKYLVVRLKVLQSSELDEPLDIMLYMIIAGLGFAASENILKFLSPDIFNLGLTETLLVATFIFITSTFLHALASGTFGFFLALSLFEPKKRFTFLASGLSLATLLHGLYNFAIMKMEENLNFAILVLFLLLSSALSVSIGFKRLKKMPSISKVR